VIRDHQNVLQLDSSRDFQVLRALGAEPRIRILELLQNRELNIGDIAHELDLPQSTTAISAQILEKAGLIKTRNANGVRGGQKICSACYKQVLVTFNPPHPRYDQDAIVTEMPVGLFTGCDISAPCGICGPAGIINNLDEPESFFAPERSRAGLIWFAQGSVEYQFPNSPQYNDGSPLKRLELSMEMSSRVPGTNAHWPSTISVWVNDVEIGTWTSPGDFADRRGQFTPAFWQQDNSQYGLLTTWEVTDTGAYIDRLRVSAVTLQDLHISEHPAIRVRIGVKQDAANVGGINIFGNGFGDYNQGIRMRLF
jgi:predicted transcriptional regulator